MAFRVVGPIIKKILEFMRLCHQGNKSYTQGTFENKVSIELKVIRSIMNELPYSASRKRLETPAIAGKIIQSRKTTK